MPHLRAEVGMHYPTNHRFVTSLIGELALDERELLEGDDRNFFHLRGRRFHAADFRSPEKIPYHLADDEVGHDPGALMHRVLERLMPLDADLTVERWDELRRTISIDGRPLQEHGF